MRTLTAVVAVGLTAFFCVGLTGCGGSDSYAVGSEAGSATDSRVFARDLDPGPGVSAVLALEQNWTDEDANQFYNAPQGSRLIPYDWFLHLEQADRQAPFAGNEHIRRLGYLPRNPGNGNPDGLPIGFIRDAAYDDGTPGLGMTCAACHTAQINFTRDGATTAYLIDGAPTLGDFESFLRALENALQATLNSDNKFYRFASAVIPGAGPAEKDALREKLSLVTKQRRRYNQLNLPGAGSPAYGHGRLDAFGAIMNQVAVEFVGKPANFGMPNAPVSYPFLWDTPQHDLVQWNGSSPNITIPILEPFIGTAAIGALIRNAGQTLGVFGMVDPSHELNFFGGYQSTVNKPSLIAINASLTSLWSPLWPDQFGTINKSKAAAGAKLFAQICQTCHENQKLTRTDPQRTIQAQMHAVGTDGAMAANFALRTADSGVLAGRFESLAVLYTGEPLGPRAPLAKLLQHMSIRAVFGTSQPSAAGSAILGDGVLSDAQSPTLGLAKSATQGTEFAYKARPLNGIWATAPYLHNGSVPNLWELLKSPTAANTADRRIAEFYVGRREYDPEHVGFQSEQGPFRFDTALPGNSNSGHIYGTDLDDAQKWQLVEYMKTL